VARQKLRKLDGEARTTKVSRAKARRWPSSAGHWDSAYVIDCRGRLRGQPRLHDGLAILSAASAMTSASADLGGYSPRKSSTAPVLASAQHTTSAIGRICRKHRPEVRAQVSGSCETRYIRDMVSEMGQSLENEQSVAKCRDRYRCCAETKVLPLRDVRG